MSKAQMINKRAFEANYQIFLWDKPIEKTNIGTLRIRYNYSNTSEESKFEYEGFYETKELGNISESSIVFGNSKDELVVKTECDIKIQDNYYNFSGIYNKTNVDVTLWKNGNKSSCSLKSSLRIIDKYQIFILPLCIDITSQKLHNFSIFNIVDGTLKDCEIFINNSQSARIEDLKNEFIRIELTTKGSVKEKLSLLYLSTSPFLLIKSIRGNETIELINYL